MIPPGPTDATHLDPASAKTEAVSRVRLPLAEAPTLAGGPGHDTLPAASLPSLSEVRAGGSLSELADTAAPRYEARSLLGVGGMGEVELHADRRIGRQVALKTIRPEHASEAAAIRFLREARVQGQLEHPAIVPVYDLGLTEAGRPYFTMKRVNGLTLAAAIDELARATVGGEAARFTRRKLLGAFLQVCRAVEYAHARGVCHRDLKPANVMLGDFGEVYVLDWGLAKLASDVDAPGAIVADMPLGGDVSNLTAHGDVLGTPAYMPPEQLRGATVDARADVFSLGAILFEILTLEPFRRATSLAKLLAEASAEPEHPSERAAGVPPELDALCARALSGDRARRVGSALELADAIERYLDGDRDLALRTALAASHLAAARRKLEADATDAGARVSAIREAMRALVLAPDDAETQELLLSLVVDGAGALPADAERELTSRVVAEQRQVARFGIYGYLSWLACLPIAMLVGIRDWTAPIALAALTAACIGVAFVMVRGKLPPRTFGLTLGAITAAVVALTSAWLGPFVLVPLASLSTGIMFIMHSPKEDRAAHLTLWSAAVAVPFVVERLHIFPAAYSFGEAGLLLHPRALFLTEAGTLAALAYTSIASVLMVLFFVGKMRDGQRDAERRLFVQAWYLRQLFPAADGASERR